MKEPIELHRKNIKSIKKCIAFDEKWFSGVFAKRKKELEFYEWQIERAESKKLESFDRNKFMV